MVRCSEADRAWWIRLGEEANRVGGTLLEIVELLHESYMIRLTISDADIDALDVVLFDGPRCLDSVIQPQGEQADRFDRRHHGGVGRLTKLCGPRRSWPEPDRAIAAAHGQGVAVRRKRHGLNERARVRAAGHLP